MRKSIAGLLSLAVASTVGMSLTAPATGAPATGNGPDGASGADTAPVLDDLPSPLEDKRRELREEALTQVINGEATPQDRGVSTVLKVGETAESATATGRQGKNKDQYVELARETTDRIFVILAEFGNERHPSYPDQDTEPAIPGPARFDGPLRNEIPEPDRTIDNSTVWQPDYNREHFQRLYFGTDSGDESLKQYYEKQSSGRYSVDGIVTDWVKVRYNEARYGRSNGFPCSGNVCSNTWFLIQDAVNQWVADQQAAGRTDARDRRGARDIRRLGPLRLRRRRQLQRARLLHRPLPDRARRRRPGRWRSMARRGRDLEPPLVRLLPGSPGSPPGPPQNPLGGTQIDNLGLWVGDYTIQPENGGRSVFYHEYGHDLGLPDLYDTASGGDQIGWWSIMAQSRLVREGRRRHRHPRRRPRPVGEAADGLARLRDHRGRSGADMWLGPHEYNSPKTAGAGHRAAAEGGHHRTDRAGRGRALVVQRSRQRLRRHDEPRK